MTDLVAFDPGAKAVGWAQFRSAVLIDCGLLRAKSIGEMNVAAQTLRTRLPPDARAIIEYPQVYDRRLWKGDPNDLVRIALVGGVVVGAVRPLAIEAVLPRVWKGQVSKDVMGRRILSRLSDVERARVVTVKPAYLVHNCVDAIGLGLWKLGRL